MSAIISISNGFKFFIKGIVIICDCLLPHTAAEYFFLLNLFPVSEQLFHLISHSTQASSIEQVSQYSNAFTQSVEIEQRQKEKKRFPLVKKENSAHYDLQRSGKKISNKSKIRSTSITKFPMFIFHNSFRINFHAHLRKWKKKKKCAEQSTLTSPTAREHGITVLNTMSFP